MLEHFPYAQTFHLGLFRDKHNFTPTEYYSKLPSNLNERVDIVYLLDPVVATGGTACAAVAMLQGGSSLFKPRNSIQATIQKSNMLISCIHPLQCNLADAGVPIANIKLLCVIASMPGLQQILSKCPGLDIYVAAVDQELNDHGMISPGIGDCGDRLFLTFT